MLLPGRTGQEALPRVLGIGRILLHSASCGAKLCISLQNLSRFLELLKKFQQPVGIECSREWSAPGQWPCPRVPANDRHAGLTLLDLLHRRGARHISNSGVKNNAIDSRKFGQGLESFRAAVRGDDIEFRCLDDEFTSRNAARVPGRRRESTDES